MADEIVKEAVEQLEHYQNGWRNVYDAAEDDLRFYLPGNQWDANDANSRRTAMRPVITVNRLPQFVHQVVNDIRQNTPTVKFLPVDDQSDPETAELLQDLYRNIEQVSSASIAYDTAAECAIKCGVGFIQVDHDYTAPDTFEQHILIRRIANPMSVMIDPDILQADGSDAKGGFKLDSLPEAVFKKLYPGAKAENFNSNYMMSEAKSFLARDKHITIAEFFKQITKQVTILRLSNGMTVYADDYKDMPDQFPIVAERQIDKNTVKRYKLTGAEELECTDFPSSYIPLVPVFGEEHWSEGERYFISLIRNAKDPQRMHNYWASLETELLQKAPKATWIMAEGQAEGYEDQWRNPDAVNVATYKQIDINGKPAPPPSRVMPPPVPAGVVNARMSTVEDIKAAMGMYDPSLGKQQSDQSGKAIMAQQKQGDTATFHFADNLSRSIQHVGRIVLDMIPVIHDTPQILRVVGEDGTPKQVAVNGAQAIPGQDKIYDINVGKYDVVCSTGPSYANKQQEAVQTFAQLGQGNPQLAMITSYFIAKNLNAPGSEMMAAAIKKILPPGLVDDDQRGEIPDLRPQMQQAQNLIKHADAAIESLQQQISQLQQEAQSTQQQNQIKMAEVGIKQQELKIKAAQHQLEVFKAQAEIDAENKRLALDAMEVEANLISKQVDSEHGLDLAIVQAEADKGVAHIDALASMQSQVTDTVPPA